jgi:MFS family permease
MSAIQGTTVPREAKYGSDDKFKTAVGSAVGTTIENYDFLAYGTASAIYFGNAFFPNDDPTVGVLLSFATFGVGFAMRPIGGLVAGHLGDRVGRKPVLIGALIVMGVATVLIGCLPTYQVVGIWAPILLVLIRLVQGLAFGAEWGGAVIMSYEHAPWKKRGQYTGIPQAGVPLGVLLANVVFLVSDQWGGEWAWRAPFLFSAVLVIAGLVIRTHVSESPEFEASKASGELEKSPISSVLRKDSPTIVRIICLRMAESGGFYAMVTYMMSYIKSNDIAPQQVALRGLVIASAIGIFGTVAWGVLSDHVGRKPLYICGSVGIMLFAFPMFSLVHTGNAVVIALVYVIGLAVLHDMLAASQGSWLPEQFRTGTRSSGASIGYQFSAALSGFIPLIAAALSARYGSAGVSWVYLACGLVGLIGALTTPETWTRARRDEVDRAIAEL